MRKKFLAMLLAVVMAAAMLPTAFAADSDFKIDEDGVLTAYIGDGGDVVIPDGITVIGSWAFLDCTSLASVTIPDSVTNIGWGAFRYCTSLTSVTIPDSVTNIMYAAFHACNSLTDVYYSGTEAQWGEIVVSGEGNFGIMDDSGIRMIGLYGVTIHYNSTGPEAEEPTDPGTPAITFDDVDPEEYYFAAVNWAVENQYAVGTDPNIFSPDDTCTHIQILTFLWRAAGRPSAPQAPNPIDPGYHEDYHGAYNWAYDKGMIGDEFDPEADCTRADTVQYLWLANDGETGIEDQGFIDLTGDEDYFDAVNWAAFNGITKGDGSVDTFNPTGTCTRGEIVTFLHRVHVPEVRDYR